MQSAEVSCIYQPCVPRAHGTVLEGWKPDKHTLLWRVVVIDVRHEGEIWKGVLSRGVNIRLVRASGSIRGKWRGQENRGFTTALAKKDRYDTHPNDPHNSLHPLQLQHFNSLAVENNLKMAQGTVKKSTTKPTTQKNPQRKQTGSRVIKPKKAQLQKQQAMKKKHTAGLTALTERSLAGRAGHLEMLGGGKKEKKVEGKKG